MRLARRLKLQNFSITIKILSSGVICPYPWAIRMYESVWSLNVLSEIARPFLTRFHMVERVLTICSNGSASMNKMTAMSIYDITHLNIFSRTEKALRLNQGIEDSRSIEFVEMMILGWPLTNVRFASPNICMVENVEKSFSQNVSQTNCWNLHFMIKVVYFLVIIKILLPSGLSALGSGL